MTIRISSSRCACPFSSSLEAEIHCFCILIVGLLLSFASPPRLEAAFHEQMSLDTKAISLANTVTADPPGLLSIHYNPAGLSHLPEGAFLSFGLTFPHIKKTSRFRSDPEFEGFLGGFKDDPLAGTEGTNSSARMYVPFYNGTVDFQVAPSFGISHRKPGSKWTFAIGSYAPYGVGLVHGDEGDPARFGGKSMYQQHFIYAAPSASYQATRTLSFGISVGLGMTVVGAELDARAPSDMVGVVKVLADATEDLEIPVLSELTFPPPWFGGGMGVYDQIMTFEVSMRDNFSPSFNIGMLWEPRKWFAFGAVYQSPIKTHLTGNYKFTYSDQWQQMMNWFGSTITTVPIATIFNLPTKGIPWQSGTMTAEMEFPQRVQFGIKVKPFKRQLVRAGGGQVRVRPEHSATADGEDAGLSVRRAHSGLQAQFQGHLALERGDGTGSTEVAGLARLVRMAPHLGAPRTLRSHVCPAGPSQYRLRARFQPEDRSDH